MAGLCTLVKIGRYWSKYGNCKLQHNVEDCQSKLVEIWKLQIARLVVKSGNCLSTAFWFLLTNVSTTTRRTTKQNVDPRCTK
jgi:hypothetical protein